MDVIRLTKVSKEFKIPHEKSSGIKSAFINLILGDTKYEKLYVLQDFSLAIKKGEFVGITGNNGVGKSTLLRIIANIIEPTYGKVEVYGKVSPFLELGTGFQFELTTKENVYLYGTILGLKRREIKQRFKDIIKFAELERFVDAKLRSFSSGMLARLAFSIAVQVDADILLVDEALAVGDAGFQKKCFEVFRRFKKDGKTIILVSHDREVLEEFCDRIVHLKRLP